MAKRSEEALDEVGSTLRGHDDGHEGRHRPMLADGVPAAHEQVASDAWAEASSPAATVVVATFGRPHYLPDLLACLEVQTCRELEVVVVDNGSPGSATWDVLAAFAARTELAFVGVRVAANLGAGGGRDVGISRARGSVIVFTDDDCLPSTGWVAAMVGAFVDGVAVVQGPATPAPVEERAGPWDHSLTVAGVTPLFESANVAYRADTVRRNGGFAPAEAAIARVGRPPFGEDVLLGARVVAESAGHAFAAGADVQHRWVPRTLWAEVARQRDFVDFARLAVSSSPLRRSRWHGAFLSRDTARGDAAILGLVAAGALRRPVLALAALPWLRRSWREARVRVPDAAAAATVLGGLAAREAVAVASRIEGSVRHRVLLL